MTEIIATTALIIACWCFGKIYKDNPIIKFLRTNRGMVLILTSVALLAYDLVIHNFQFGQIIPSFYSLIVLLILLGFFYMFKDRRSTK
ncbi:hypothetical protein ERK18_01845 [Lactobacillus kimbladii]|uniref:hypothetical protein n=1 Tax=Lactobacillus kimbladii TaxID=1218506 RepID=UPI00164F601F|nr:hypothetical protein [Lactobacillus kimbladii]MBC6341771.1 hypothetical protein [Lactobacillus kimbladii]